MTYMTTNLSFDIIKPIGCAEGKNSDVYLANDRQLDTQLIIKKVKIEDLSKMDEYFLEARLLYDNKHPNIMEIQYATYDDGYIYLSMPFHEKGSLNGLINQRFLSVREIVKYSLDFLSGIAYIHSKGLIHLDIKPTNILLDKSDRAILTDFGLSRYLDEYGLVEQSKNYTTHIDPQWFLYSKRSVSSDIYQIGLTLYRLCNGNEDFYNQYNSFNVQTYEDLEDIIVSGKFPNRNKYLPHIPKKLQKIIKSCLEIDVEKRYNNVIEIMNDLSDLSENLDWQYTNKSPEVYYLNKGTHRISISVMNNNHGYDIICTKINIITNNATRMTKYCSTGYNTMSEVYNELQKIIKDNN